MTCSEALGLLVAVDLRRLSGPDHRGDPEDAFPGELVTHIAECQSCGRVARLLAAGERTLAASLDADVSARPFALVAETAWAGAKRYRFRRFVAASAAVVLVSVSALIGREVFSEARRLLTPQPPVVTQTFPLTCLTSEQAADLLRPYLPMPLNPRWQAERFSVTPAPSGIRAVTVGAPRELIDRVPQLLARYEAADPALCPR